MTKLINVLSIRWYKGLALVNPAFNSELIDHGCQKEILICQGE